MHSSPYKFVAVGQKGRVAPAPPHNPSVLPASPHGTGIRVLCSYSVRNSGRSTRSGHVCVKGLHWNQAPLCFPLPFHQQRVVWYKAAWPSAFSSPNPQKNVLDFRRAWGGGGEWGRSAAGTAASVKAGAKP